MNWNSWAILYKKLCIFQVSAKYMCNSHRVLQSRCRAQLNFYVPLWMSLNKKNLSIISKNISTYKSYSNKIIKEKRWRTSKCKIADHQSVRYFNPEEKSIGRSFIHILLVLCWKCSIVLPSFLQLRARHTIYFNLVWAFTSWYKSSP